MNDTFQSMTLMRLFPHNPNFHLSLSHIQRHALLFSKDKFQQQRVNFCCDGYLKLILATQNIPSICANKTVYKFGHQLYLVSQNRKSRSPPCRHFATPHDRWSGSVQAFRQESDKNDESNDDNLMKMNIGVSKNNGTPKSSISIGFSIINHPFWGTPIFGNTHILTLSTLFL